VDVTTDQNIDVTGVNAVGPVGTVEVVATANENVTGVYSPVIAGTVIVEADSNLDVTGVSAVGVVGTIDVTG